MEILVAVLALPVAALLEALRLMNNKRTWSFPACSY